MRLPVRTSTGTVLHWPNQSLGTFGATVGFLALQAMSKNLMSNHPGS
jgi:hypothetical protein